MTLIDEIRTRLVQNVEASERQLETWNQTLRVDQAKLAAYDAAVEAMRDKIALSVPLSPANLGPGDVPERAKRRDLNALVFEALSESEPLSIAQIAQKVGNLKTGQVDHALSRLAGRMTYDLRPRVMLAPQEGFWLIRLRKGAPFVPAAIMRMETIAEPGCSENDMRGTRSPFLAAFVLGEPVDMDEVWMRKGLDITESEYRFQIADMKYALAYAPDEAQANPRKPIDWMQAALPF